MTNAASPHRARFLALYAALDAVVIVAGLGAYTTYKATPPRASARECWASGPSLVAALYSAANCRFGARNVFELGWMPYLGASEEQKLEEVAVIRPDGGMSFWIASFSGAPRNVRVEHWVPCPASNEFC